MMLVWRDGELGRECQGCQEMLFSINKIVPRETLFFLTHDEFIAIASPS